MSGSLLKHLLVNRMKRSINAQHPSIGTTDELELITSPLHEDSALFSIFDDPLQLLPPEEKDVNTLKKPKLRRESRSEPISPPMPPIYLVSMAVEQSDLWDHEAGQKAWEKFIMETKTGLMEFSKYPEHVVRRNMRIALLCCAYDLSGCQLFNELRLCIHRWFTLPQFDDYSSLEAKLLSGDTRSIRQICETFTPEEGGAILEGIYRTHHEKCCAPQPNLNF